MRLILGILISLFFPITASATSWFPDDHPAEYGPKLVIAFITILIFWRQLYKIWQSKLGARPFWVKGLVLGVAGDILYASIFPNRAFFLLFFTLFLAPLIFPFSGLMIGGIVDLLKKKYLRKMTFNDGKRLVVLALIFALLDIVTSGPLLAMQIAGFTLARWFQFIFPFVLGTLIYIFARIDKMRQVLIGVVLNALFVFLISLYTLHLCMHTGTAFLGEWYDFVSSVFAHGACFGYDYDVSLRTFFYGVALPVGLALIGGLLTYLGRNILPRRRNHGGLNI